MIAWLQAKGLQILGILAAVAFVFGLIRRDAWKDFEARDAKRRLDAVRKKNEVDNEIENLGSNDLDERLRKWVRK